MAAPPLSSIATHSLEIPETAAQLGAQGSPPVPPLEVVVPPLEVVVPPLEVVVPPFPAEEVVVPPEPPVPPEEEEPASEHELAITSPPARKIHATLGTLVAFAGRLFMGDPFSPRVRFGASTPPCSARTECELRGPCSNEPAARVARADSASEPLASCVLPRAPCALRPELRERILLA